ncbi:MAG: hypothetical protein SPI12_05150 [Actinomycetaceae bacterium]|nr:hypothetical protein [Actinomycetaceae bacterium]MDY6083231.1 hypothetical protein [Actinomycetaceae bacterium]
MTNYSTSVGTEHRVQHTLILMRHSTALASGNDLARPLSAEGRQRAGFQGLRLIEDVGSIDRVLVSDALRTQQTLEAMISVGLQVKDVSIEHLLYSASGPRVLDAITETDESVRTLLVLFHQPSVSTAAIMLTPEQDRRLLTGGFPPATYVVGLVDAAWADLETWTLQYARRPQGA